jgi:hypothetical protein
MQEREVHEGRLLGEGEKDHRFECLVTKTSPTCSACSSSAKDTKPTLKLRRTRWLRHRPSAEKTERQQGPVPVQMWQG